MKLNINIIIKNKSFDGSPERKENILNILETKANEIIDVIVKTFIQSYDDYLNEFGIETPPAMDIIQRRWQYIFEILNVGLLKNNSGEVMKNTLRDDIKKITGKEPSPRFSSMSFRSYLRRQFYRDIEGYEKEFREFENNSFVYGAFQIRDMGKKLLNINNLPLEKKFAILNEAINLTHNVGYFMFHYNRLFKIDKSDLDKLSNLDVSEWNEELREIGVEI